MKLLNLPALIFKPFSTTTCGCSGHGRQPLLSTAQLVATKTTANNDSYALTRRHTARWRHRTREKSTESDMRQYSGLLTSVANDRTQNEL